ncbi:MAG: hypothetical protein F6K19_18480 [Cyanothece sp. SIO1E1]|nr:hypothetical protein [Cyanothece sp. SIO1E1]
MFTFNHSHLNGQDRWRFQLDQFVKAHQLQLAALAWGLFLGKSENQDILGIDLKPEPHFIYCSREAVETLNRDVDNHLQEILGLVDAHNPEQEVLLIAIGDGQIKLVNFQPDPPPPDCFERVAEQTETLLTQLEAQMAQQIKI